MWGNRRLFRRFARKTFGNTDFRQIKGVLVHAEDTVEVRMLGDASCTLVQNLPNWKFGGLEAWMLGDSVTHPCQRPVIRPL